MPRPAQSKTDLFASLEDDVRQCWEAVTGAFRAAPGAMAKRIAMPTFAYRVDLWDSTGEKVLRPLAGIEDVELAMATYRAACERWPGANITLQAGAKLIEDRRQPRTPALKYPLA
jgi:hypothetical protein